MKSFGVCLQIDCLLTERPKHFPSRTSTFFLTGTHWLWTGTHDFSQDESQVSPQLFVTKSLVATLRRVRNELVRHKP